jgi:hypothetical protein
MTVDSRAASKPKAWVASLVLALLLSACSDGHLRGFVEPSTDGGTYLVFEDDHGGCPIQVNGEPWPHERGEVGAVDPGTQVVECGGGTLSFIIPEGVVFHFDYWGP